MRRAQTSDDEAAPDSRKGDQGHGTAAHHGLHSSRHAISLQPALQPQDGHEQRNGSAGHMQPDDDQLRQHHGVQHQQPTSDTAAAATDLSVDALQVFPSRHVPRWSPLLLAYFPIGAQP